MDNWIDLSCIPKIGNSTNNNWEQSLGRICNFYYKGVSGKLKIVGHNVKTHSLSILYDGQVKTIGTNYFKDCKLGNLLGLINKDFKVEIGQEFIDDNRNIKIIGRKMKKDNGGITRKMYNYHCNVCNWDDGWIDESHLLHGIGCSCCAKTVIVPYVNDVYTTNPELVKYFKYEEDTHKTTACSKKKFMMVCPFCGNEQLYSTEKLSTYGFSCKRCGDGISYGEKFIYSLLKQIKENFITQLSRTTFDWCDKYKYDFYLPRINTIIEVHGIQHYEETRNSLYRYSTSNDEIKEKLAKQNGIKNYIVIDCRKSNLQYIKESIINTNLLQLLNVTENEINWVECDRFTSKSLLVEACEYKNNHPELSTTDIGKVFHMARTTIQSYLQKGANLGICIYDKEFERKFKTKEARLKYYSNKYQINQQF